MSEKCTCGKCPEQLKKQLKKRYKKRKYIVFYEDSDSDDYSNNYADDLKLIKEEIMKNVNRKEFVSSIPNEEINLMIEERSPETEPVINSNFLNSKDHENGKDENEDKNDKNEDKNDKNEDKNDKNDKNEDKNDKNGDE